MALSLVFSEIFNVEKYCDLEITVRGQSRPLKWAVQYTRYGFLLLFYSNFVPKTFEIFDFKNTVTLKTGLGSIKVIENVTIRYSAYDFLLTFHSNHGPISYRFRDRRRFQSKITKFSTHCYFAPPLKGFPLELGISAGSKTRMMGLPSRQRRLTVSSANWIEYTNVTDRRTDIGPQQRPRLLTACVAR